MGWRLGALGWGLLAFAVLLFARPAGDPLQIMAEHAPADGTDPVLKAFGTPDARASVVFEDRHARFGAAAPRLHLSEQGLFVQALFQACWIFWADHRADATLGEEGFVVLAVKAAVGHHVAEFVGKIHGLDAFDTFTHFLAFAWSFSFIQLVINDQSSPAFGKEQFVAELDLAASFATDNHIDVRFVGTEDFVRIVDLASADDPLVCLFDNLREQFEFFVNPGEDTCGLCGAVTCVLLPRFEQVAVPAGGRDRGCAAAVFSFGKG